MIKYVFKVSPFVSLLATLSSSGRTVYVAEDILCRRFGTLKHSKVSPIWLSDVFQSEHPNQPVPILHEWSWLVLSH